MSCNVKVSLKRIRYSALFLLAILPAFAKAQCVPKNDTVALHGCGSLTNNGITYSSSTVVHDTLKAVAGCDSIYRTTQINIVTPISQNISLHGCNELVFNGVTYINSAIANDTIFSVTGCDSVVVTAAIQIDHLAAISNISYLAGCGNVVYNGSTYFSSLILADTTRSVTGCDSIYNIVNIRVVNPVTKNTMVKGCGSVVFNGITYTSAATIRDTVKSSLGCDSLYNVTRILIQNIIPVYQATSFSSCRSVVYNGVTYTVTTIVQDTLKSSYGCDSVYRSTTIKIQDIAPLIQTIFLSDCDSVVYNNHTYTASVNTKDTLKSTFGCDSILINLNIRISGTPLKDSSTLRDCSSILFNSILYTDSTIVRDTIRTTFGCDSIYKITNIIIRNIVPKSKSDTLSGCTRLTFNGVDYMDSTIVSDTLRTAESCDSIYRTTYINIQKITPLNKDTTLSSCKAIILNGNTYNASTMFTDTLKTTLGCDSILQTTHIIITSITPVVNTKNLTGCSSIFYNDSTYTASTMIRDTVRSAGGCDSVYNLTNISIRNNAVTQSTSFTSCSSVFYNGINYTNSAVITDTVRNAAGCDSIYKVTNINIQNNPVTQVNTIVGCHSLVYHGITYTASALVKDTVRSIQYCDSIYHVTNIVIKNIVPVSQTNAITGCNSVLFNGSLYNASAIVLDTLRTPEGCDSVFRTNIITVQNIVPVTNTRILNGCNSLLYNGINYTASTTITETIKSAGQCDSIYNIIDIRIVSPISQNNAIRSCNGSILFNGINYTSSTTVADTLKSVFGCDSVYRTNFIYVENITPTIHTTNLSGCGSVLYNGTVYTSPVTLTDTVKTAGGCDSIYHKVNIAIVINPTVNSNTINGCGSVTFNGVVYYSSVVLNDTLRTVGGCDSVYNVTSINVQNIAPVSMNSTFRGCNGGVVVNGVIYTSSAVIKDTVKSVMGCDSVYVTNNIIVENIIAQSHVTNLSDCQSITFNGVTFTSSGMVSDTIRTAGGCDSIYNITNITINTPIVRNSILNGCDSVVFGGSIYFTSASVTDTVKSLSGCDSMYSITSINVQHVTPQHEINTIAGCASLVLNGVIYTSSTILLDTLKSTAGCDSVFQTTNIIVQHITPVKIVNSLEGCNSLVYNGTTYTSSIVIKDTVLSIGGCDSLYNTTNINIVKAITVTHTLKGCNNFVFNGVTYSASTIIIDTIKTIKGCDSLYTITNLNIHNIQPVSVTNVIKACGSTVFNGLTYTVSTTVLDTLRTLDGCDSIFRTNNIIIQNITPVTIAKAINGCKNVEYNGVYYNSSGLVKDTLKSELGCDSVYNITTITVNDLKLNISASPSHVILGNPVNVKVTASNPFTVLSWSPKSLFADQAATSQTYKADSTRSIMVAAVSPEGCRDTASTLVTVNYSDLLFIPNTFTPNNDGRNDEFKVYGNNISKVEMHIFNQWGQMIFESNDMSKGWNGYYKGQLQPVGVYVYVVRIIMDDNSIVNRKGSLNLVR